MKSLVRPELPTASVGSSQAPTAAVDNSALFATRPQSTYKSGKVVQTTGATSVRFGVDFGQAPYLLLISAGGRTQMKYTTGTTMKILATITAIMATSTITSSAFAADEGRKMIDPATEPISKVVVQVAQLPGISKGAGNGVVVGSEACHVLTNFHVAYGKDTNPKGGMILVDNQEIGHVVEVGVDLDPKTGTFRRKIKARVVEFGNFEEGTSMGMRGDLAMLKLDECLGKQYGLVKIEKPEQGQVAPLGALTVLGFSKIAESKFGFFAEKTCGAVQKTPIAGLFVSTCKIMAGASGSPVLKQEKNGQWLLVGMQTGELTLKGGEMISYALHSSTLAPFVESVLGSEPILLRKPE